MTNNQGKHFLQMAVQLAIDSVAQGGGPFGAIITRQGEIVAQANNQVTLNNDPTAHAEVMAIRMAGKSLNRFILDDCVLYTSCEPCPMCTAAIYWSHIKRVVYAASAETASKAGFDDSFIAREICLNKDQRSIPMNQLECEQTEHCFEAWKQKQDKIEY